MRKLLLLISAIVCTGIVMAQDSKTYNITNKTVLKQSGSGTMTKLQVVMPIPQTNEYQTISDVTYSDGEIVDDKNYSNKFLYAEKTEMPDNPWELVSTFNITPKPVKIDFSEITEIKEYDKTSEAYTRHLGDRGDYIITSNPYIMETGDKLWSESANVLEYARKCYEYVAANFKYINGSWRTLDKILELGGGECGDFSTLVINLLRYKGIPSRHNICLRLDKGYHVWVDFYLEGYGWIPLDATYKHDNPSGDYFGVYDGDCIVVAQDMFYDIPEVNLEICQTYSYWYWGSTNITGNHVVTNNGIVDGIQSPSLNKTDNGTIYNLKGQKVNSTYKGIVISQGKKYIAK